MGDGGGTNIQAGGGDVVGRDKIIYGDEVRGDKHVHLPPETIPLRHRRIRDALADGVRSIWIQGILDEGIHQVARLELGLEHRPGAVRRPWVLARERPEQPPQELPAGTTIYDVWHQTGGSLLILGAPGAGKTFTLLELAQALLDAFSRDKREPVPLVFNLSSWARDGGALFDWLVEEMFLVYGVSRRYGPAWLQEMYYVLLLDGLDEVPEDKREACVRAIHTFKEKYGPVDLAVCSRAAEYEALDEPLETQGAVHIRPLSPAQVDAYLAAGGEALAGARAAVRDDPQLREMAQTPLMLNIIALTYHGRPATEMVDDGRQERWQRLFGDYVARMFARKGEARPAERHGSIRTSSSSARSRNTRRSPNCRLASTRAVLRLSSRTSEMPVLMAMVVVPTPPLAP